MKPFSPSRILADLLLQLAGGSVQAVREVLARGRCQRGSGLGASAVGDARLGDAPKRVESRRRWEGSAPDPAPQESGVGVQKALTHRGEASCPRCF